MYYFPRHLTNATALSIYTVLWSSAYYVSASNVTTLRRYTNLFIIIYYYYIYGPIVSSRNTTAQPIFYGRFALHGNGPRRF